MKGKGKGVTSPAGPKHAFEFIERTLIVVAEAGVYNKFIANFDTGRGTVFAFHFWPSVICMQSELLSVHVACGMRRAACMHAPYIQGRGSMFKFIQKGKNANRRRQQLEQTLFPAAATATISHTKCKYLAQRVRSRHQSWPH